MIHPQGNRFLFIGASDTGKSWECMQFAKWFRERKESPKKTIIFEHERNDETYGNIEKYGVIKEISLNDLDYALPQKGAFRIVSKDVETFIEKACKIKNAFFVIDDATGLFGSNIPEYLLDFLGLRKNNRIEIAFQIHTIAETAPRLFRNTDIWVIKQTGDSLPVKSSCPNWENVSKLLTECKNENAKKDFRPMWATRLYIPNENKVYRKDLSKPWATSYPKQPVNIIINPL